MTGASPAVRLVGVGMGPGDPELVTVLAVRRLAEADLVLVPVMSRDQQGRAEATVRAHLTHDRITRVVFALDEQAVSPRRQAAWEAAADRVLEAFDAGARTVAFATIGDPTIYSTFTYLAQTVRARRSDVTVETVPGITAMQALAAATGTVLCEGTEPLVLLPLTAGGDRLDEALASGASVVVYKGGRAMDQVRQALARHHRLGGAVVGASLGLPDEQVGTVERWNGPGPYLSTVIAPAPRDRRGGKL
ncbi:MAG: precorrin-2 C(20)-methyltransferase [Actinomycetes bacterium]